MLAQRILSGGGTASTVAAGLLDESTQWIDIAVVKLLDVSIERDVQGVQYGSLESQSQHRPHSWQVTGTLRI